MTYTKLLITVLLVLSCGLARSADRVIVRSGIVTHVTDGDTLWVKLDGASGKPLKLRLRSIDAPEICQAGGAAAKVALEEHILHRVIRFAPRARDTYGRTIADVWLGSEDISAWLVEGGHAWSEGYRFHPGAYAALQREAQAGRRGLFASADPLEPRLFRKLHGRCE
jgi:micrococcal nuclease